jgi:hypothetical protein
VKPTKKKSPEDKLNVLAEVQMALFSAEAEQRFESAMRVFNAQDADTKDAIARVTAVLCRIGRKRMWFALGKKGDRIVREIPEKTMWYNMFYLATEIVKDMGQMDVKISGFKFPADLCATCNTQLTKTKPIAKKKVKS